MTSRERSSQSVLRTRVCDLLGIRHLVVMGGMAGGFTSSALVAAVSNAGGLGTFGASWLTPEEVRSETTHIRELVDAGLIDAIEPAGDVLTQIVRDAYDILRQRLPKLFAST